MLNQHKDWAFIKKRSRPVINKAEAEYWRNALAKLLKVGIEIELNLPDNAGNCDRENFLCKCTAIFDAKNPIPNTSKCYEQCKKWDNGNCEIAKKHGCNGIYCVAFEAPCPNCSKYDRGCNRCPDLYDMRKDPRYLRQKIGESLNPTRFVGEHGSTGVYKVCKDGSLLGDGGVEVATVGKRVQFMPLYKMVKGILDICKENRAFLDERCSVHTHLLASYLNPNFSGNDRGTHFLKGAINEMERPLPEIVLANFHQLVRRFHCALIWMSSAGKSRKNLTRWEKFRKPILPYSAVRNRMAQVRQEVGGASKSKRKYALMNYDPVKFDANGDVNILHVEGRYMDGCWSAASIVAHACLLYGLMMKAVEFSRHGILKAGDKIYMDKQREILANLCNNDGPWDGSRHSDTSKLDPYIWDLVKQSRQVVRLIKSNLSELSPASEILNSLAERPLALRLADGESWEDIESCLAPRNEKGGPLSEVLAKIIDTSSISECDTEEEWIEAATHQIAKEENDCSAETFNGLKKEVQTAINKRIKAQKLFWSDGIGGYISH
jgi:hypothetical protein